MPTAIQVQAAVEVLAAAGWSVAPPVTAKLQLLSVGQVAQILDVHPDTARKISMSLAKTVRLPGGDIRVRVVDLERYLDEHPATPKTS